MPVRVLDKHGRGQADDIAKGIRFAVDHHADVINMSFNFGCGKKVPERRRSAARRLRAAASSPSPRSATSARRPASRRRRPGRGVIGVGGTTEGGCLGNYSLAGKGDRPGRPGRRRAGRGLPLGLGPADLPGDPESAADPDLRRSPPTTSAPRWPPPTSPASRRWCWPPTPTAARVHPGSQRAGDRPRVNGVAKRLRETARSLGLPPTQQGAGLIDAGARDRRRAAHRD